MSGLEVIFVIAMIILYIIIGAFLEYSSTSFQRSSYSEVSGKRMTRTFLWPIFLSWYTLKWLRLKWLRLKLIDAIELFKNPFR